jgi:cytochrome c peroxidase
MKNTLLTLVISIAVLPCLGSADTASTAEIEEAWLAFSNARGEASLILGDVQHPSANDVFRIIPDVSADSLDAKKLQLGLELFNERRLSKDETIACSSCHLGMMGGADRRPVPFGIGGAQGTLNTPTVFNAALNFRQFWDGRALTLQEQALGPIENPAELGHDIDSVIAVIKSIPDYVSAFDALYPDGVTAENLTDAIAYYETMNFTGLSSPFLRQFGEQQSPLSEAARRGQQRFVEVGCASCHNGVNLGGNSYQQLGVAEPWYGNERTATENDNGLFGRTGREQDQQVFKVPTLHNVAFTGPWLHDGSITSLQQTVDQMARHQSGRYLDNQDIDDIVAFLRALGDSLGMVGDCSASGSYSVTMNCDINQISTGSGQGSETIEVTLPGSAELAQRHRYEYEAAVKHASEAPARIAAEMQRIRSGEVAHYDFLQYEHIEMLRHARALSFPPADVMAEQREAMLTQAKHWQQLAEEYELTIADFLRGHAVASGARTNYQDLLRILSDQADEKTLSLLAQAERSLLGFQAQPNAGTRGEFERATQTLSELDVDSQRLAELEVQLGLLVSQYQARRRP